MPRKLTPIRRQVRHIWSLMENDKKNVTGQAVWGELVRLHDGDKKIRSLRAVQEDVLEFTEHARLTGVKFALEEWIKWDEDVVRPTALPSVLVVNAVSQEVVGRPLWKQEVRWAERIHVALECLDPVAAWFLVWSYFMRDVAKMNLDSKQPVTFDLDQLVAHQPWISENRPLWDVWVLSPKGMQGGFFNSLKGLAEQPLPPDVDRELAQWAAKQLIGPWDDENQGKWSWLRLLESRYGEHGASQED